MSSVRFRLRGPKLCEAFASLDNALQTELTKEEKDAMGYNIIMLELALYKIKRIGTHSI